MLQVKISKAHKRTKSYKSMAVVIMQFDFLIIEAAAKSGMLESLLETFNLPLNNHRKGVKES